MASEIEVMRELVYRCREAVEVIKVLLLTPFGTPFGFIALLQFLASPCVDRESAKKFIEVLLKMAECLQSKQVNSCLEALIAEGVKAKAPQGFDAVEAVREGRDRFIEKQEE